ncbi:MAG: FHA domain-containing protein [Eubacterium sp.]|nr:FHA domain-containing protein [Eubacterium sp.]
MLLTVVDIHGRMILTDIDCFHKDQISIGRRSDSDIVIGEAIVSRRHASLYKNNGSWYICDLGSTNGLYHNNTQFNILKIEENTLVTIQRSVGDREVVRLKFTRVQ